MIHGVNNNRRVPCSVSVHHGWHPSNELCGSCPAPVIKAWVPPTFPDERDLDSNYWADFLESGCNFNYDYVSDTYTLGGKRYEGPRLRRVIARNTGTLP